MAKLQFYKWMVYTRSFTKTYKLKKNIDYILLYTLNRNG